MAKKNLSEISKVTDCDLRQVRPMLTGDYIQSCIHVIRGEQVILDRDLAQLYQVDTSQMNRQVKRNIERVRTVRVERKWIPAEIMKKDRQLVEAAGLDITPE